MTIIETVKEAVKTAECSKTLPFIPTKITNHPLDHSDRWNGGHGKWYDGKYYSIINIRNADGSAKNPYSALLTYQDGDLVCDLVEQDTNIPDPDNTAKLIAMAYYIGRESAVKEICDIHSARVTAARQAAKGYRYHRMANAVLNAMGGDMIYHPDYAGDMTDTFGDDEIRGLRDELV